MELKKEADNLLYLVLIVLTVGAVGAFYKGEPSVDAFVLEATKALFVAVLVKIKS